MTTVLLNVQWCGGYFKLICNLVVSQLFNDMIKDDFP